jgi:hypothetical protein
VICKIQPSQDKKKYQFTIRLDLCRTEWLHDAVSSVVRLNLYLVVPSKSAGSSEAEFSGAGRSSFKELHMLNNQRMKHDNSEIEIQNGNSQSESVRLRQSVGD